MITASFSQDSIKRLEPYLEIEHHDWLKKGRPFKQAELKELARDKEIIVVETCEIQKEVIDAAPELKIVACCRGLKGDDSTIDVEACNQKNIPIIYAPGRNLNAVAEHTLLLVLAVMRKVKPATRWLYENRWQQWLDFYTTFRTSEIMGKTVGLVGFGDIGRRVAQLFLAFGASVLASDPYVADDIFEEYGVTKVDLETLLKNADIVSLHVNVSKETMGLIDAEKISLMKPTSFLVNTARAVVVEHDALYNALKEGRIAGAALDVFYQEPTGPEKEPLLTLDNVFATPHLGGTTNEVIDNHSKMVENDIIRLLSGEKPVYLLNPEVLPNFREKLQKG
ncbi:MAG: 2-hydroxyacid dehydrogenase [Dethiobacteria bacterium]